MKKRATLYLALIVTIFSTKLFAQEIIEYYKPASNETLKIGPNDNDVLPFIQKGYTLMTPKNKPTKGVLIFLEDSGYDEKNKNAKQLYSLASKEGFTVLSVSTQVPFDFYFLVSSMTSTHNIIQEVFTKHNLPNQNIFFLGASLTGHRAMRYIQFVKESNPNFQLNIEGLVICNFTLDWTRKWYQHKRDIRINKIDLWEPKFINYMLETHLNGTPESNPESYHDFSPYSYFNEENKNIQNYKDYAFRAYTEPAIKHRLKKYYRTLYENNATDIVGFIAELELSGNEDVELVILQRDEEILQKPNPPKTWDTINKDELMQWIKKQI